ncbi:MAG: response regulator [bacterium]|nr:response regulator [bacterium]
MQRSNRQTLEQVSRKRGVVLVVDDEKGPRESLRMILSSGHEVLVADGGSSALEILRTHHVDLVTVDLNMPVMRGEELAEIIYEEFPGTKIIIITASATIEAAVAGIRCQVSDFITKPFDVVQVNASVGRAVDQRLAGAGGGAGRAYVAAHNDRLAEGTAKELAQ